MIFFIIDHIHSTGAVNYWNWQWHIIQIGDHITVDRKAVTLVKNGMTQEIEDLDQFGADIDAFELNTPDADGNTAVMVAAICGDVKSLQLLKKYGCDFTIKNKQGNCPLIAASYWNRIDSIQFLISNNLCDINECGKNGITALIATTINLRKKTKKDFALDAMRILLNQPDINVNIADNDGNTVLFHCVSRNNIEGVRMLLTSQYDIDCGRRNKKGYTAVMEGVRNGFVDILQLLLKHGAMFDETFVDNTNDNWMTV